MNRLILGIVGHTNTGKTSLIRTLLRNRTFGLVEDRAGTTRHVEQASIAIDDNHVLELRDTPGLEDSEALKLELDKLLALGLSGRECLERFTADTLLQPEFEQEIKVLKQAYASDLLLYVIDCREPLLTKYIQEIQCLQMAARPLLPVLNFIHAEQSALNAWKNKLADLGLHASVAFDTVAFDFEAEKRLYQKLQTLMEPHYELLQKLIDRRGEAWRHLKATACTRVARLLLDTAAVEVPERQPEALRERLRDQEHQCLQDLLGLMQFEQADIEMTQLPVSNGRWQLDLFSGETLKLLSLDTASAAATGAAIGVGVDLLLAGTSLGAASATGAALGAAWHNSRRFGKRLWQKFSNQPTLYADDLTFEVLLLRQTWLLHTLFKRGHAAVLPDKINSKPDLKTPKEWPKIRQRLRACALGFGEKPAIVVEHTANWLVNQVQ